MKKYAKWTCAYECFDPLPDPKHVLQHQFVHIWRMVSANMGM